MTVAELTTIADRLYDRWMVADREADQAQQRADALHREWAKAKRRERAAIAATPENVEPLCDACNDTGFVDDLDNDGASVRCEWCPTPENVDSPGGQQ